MKRPDPRIYYVMGVSGSGKSTVGKLLADRLGIPFLDGDHYHTEENVRKMAAGNPLTDEDRLQWLQRLNVLARENLGTGAVIVCSALKRKYREILALEIAEKVLWIYLEGSYDLIMERLRKRKGHFMPAGLLASQFETLEPPENALYISIEPVPSKIVDYILEQLSGKP